MSASDNNCGIVKINYDYFGLCKVWLIMMALIFMMLNYDDGHNDD